ncbi:vesicle coat protein [Tirmania nivea]|nr:vesicle coat protein [Tirmania nivea]
MNFMVSLAHFCEVHGPTSILCTQVIPPECSICDPTTESSMDSDDDASTPQSRTQGGGQSADGSANRLLASQAPTPRPYSTRGVSSNSSSSLSSPMETPPASPRSSVLTCSSLPSSVAGPGIGAYASTAGSGGSSLTETCRNCSISLPRSIEEKQNNNSERTSDKITKPNPPVLRTKDTIPAHGPGDVGHFGPGWQGDSVKESQHSHQIQRIQSENGQSASILEELKPCFGNIPPRSSASSSLNSEDEDGLNNMDSDPPIPVPSVQQPKNYGLGQHGHSVTYLSTRAPTTPSRFSMLRQSCIRTLSCELLPAQTGPLLFGDTLTGFTIAYVFRIADPKARGGKRSYALLCICPEQKVVVPSWKYVVGTFEGLVQRINGYATLKNATEKAAAAKASAQNNAGGSSGSLTGRIGAITGPEGFLRRRDGVGSAKGLAELVGKEDLFVEVHACFVKLLGALVRRYGLAQGTKVTEDGEKAIKVGHASAALAVDRSNFTRSKSMAMQGGIDKTNLLGDGTSTTAHRRLSTGATGNPRLGVSPRGVAAG